MEINRCCLQQAQGNSRYAGRCHVIAHTKCYLNVNTLISDVKVPKRDVLAELEAQLIASLQVPPCIITQGLDIKYDPN